MSDNKAVIVVTEIDYSSTEQTVYLRHLTDYLEQERQAFEDDLSKLVVYYTREAWIEDGFSPHTWDAWIDRDGDLIPVERGTIEALRAEHV